MTPHEQHPAPKRDQGFDEWWALYPRKVAKLAALKAWRRVATSDAVVEQIMAGLRAQLHMMVTKDKSFIPHASTWLNGERWKDDHIAPASKPCVIACEKCGDTGVVFCYGNIETYGEHDVLLDLTRCDCSRGQLPGLMTGPIHAEDAL